MGVGAVVSGFVSVLHPVGSTCTGSWNSLSWISEVARSRLSLLSDMEGVDHSRPAFLGFRDHCQLEEFTGLELLFGVWYKEALEVARAEAGVDTHPSLRQAFF